MDDLRSKVLAVHADAKYWTRQDIETGLAAGAKRKTRPYFTRYEWTALLGTRVQQLKTGAQPLVSIDDLAAGPDLEYRIAEKEALQQKLPFIIMRTLPGGPEWWSAQELTKIH